MVAYIPRSAARAFGGEQLEPDAQLKVVPRPRVVTLCGSTRFMNVFDEQNTKLTLEGKVVFSVALKAHEGSASVTVDQKELLDRVHLEKIRLSDEILVLNVGGYIGDSTRNEIEFAHKLGKIVAYLEPLQS